MAQAMLDSQQIKMDINEGEKTLNKKTKQKKNIFQKLFFGL